MIVRKLSKYYIFEFSKIFDNLKKVRWSHLHVSQG